jgi:DNA-directed RNA polymerase subunit H
MYMGKKLNIFEHELVPKHRIMSEKEVEELLKKYGVTKKELPKILDSDPAVKALGAKVGDVIEIQRESPVAGVIKYYRVVVKKKS